MTTAFFADATILVPFSVEVWPGVKLEGTLRPPTGAELAAYDRAAAASKDPTAVRCEFYARHLKSWNVDGEPTAANVGRLHAAAFGALEGVIVGGHGCDFTGESLLGK